MSETYKLEKIGDLMLIPLDKIDLAMKEIGEAVKCSHAAAALLKEVAKDSKYQPVPQDITLLLSHINWINDDKGQITLIMPDPGEE
jgi:hypothetical protein